MEIDPAATDAANAKTAADPNVAALADADTFHALRMPSVRIDGVHVLAGADFVRLTFTEKGDTYINLHAHARASVTMSRDAALGIAMHIIRSCGGAVIGPDDE
jgi:hypothetical protein